MELNQLKYFKAVADFGKIVLAAEELFVTPSAVSASISALEKELNTELFVRSGNRLVLNRQGEIFLDYANYILRSVSDAKHDLYESMRESRGQVVVGATSVNPWVNLFSSFIVSRPEIELTTASIDLKDVNTAGLNSRFSFLFASEFDPDEKYAAACDSISLFEDAPAVMVNRTHPFAKKEWVEPELLLEEKVFMPRLNTNVQKQILKVFERRDLPVSIHSTHYNQVIGALVKKNAGVVLTTLQSENLTTEEFAFVPLNAGECRWKQKMFWRKNRTLSKEEKIFFEFVKDYFDND